MGILKTSLYGLALSLLASCSLFSSTPSKVIDGQRGAYQGILVVQDNVDTILNTYEEDCKAAVLYHVTFVYEEKIQAVRLAELSDADKKREIAELESKRDEEVRSTFAKIEKRRKDMAGSVSQNIVATKKLVEAVYNYLSATPITVDNVDFWIVKIVEASRGRE